MPSRALASSPAVQSYSPEEQAEIDDRERRLADWKKQKAAAT